MITPERFKEIRSLFADISDKLSEDELNAISDLLECSSDVIEIANTRPTPAPCDELVTVGWLWEYAQYRTDERGYYGYETVITENNPTDHVSPAEKLRNIRELVTRQNAEEVIAAKDARIKELERLLGLSQSVHRWNIDASGDGILYVCKDDHDKSEPCEWNAFIPIERAEADNKRLREAVRAAHDTLMEINPSNYNHDDVCQMNDASVEAIYLLADVLGETHGKTEEWWDIRRAALGEVKT